MVEIPDGHQEEIAFLCFAVVKGLDDAHRALVAQRNAVALCLCETNGPQVRTFQAAQIV